MARGWESKSVEDQVQAAEDASAMQPMVSNAEKLELDRKRDGLLRQRTRVLRDLRCCENERYRQTLENGLAYLEGELRKTGWD